MKLVPIRHNHSVCLICFHVVFCTKYRKPELTEAITISLFEQAIGKYSQLKILEGEVMPDHCHFLVQADSTTLPSDIAKNLKCYSSALIKKALTARWSGWGVGYFISSVGANNADAVQHYIQNQKG